MDKFDSVEKILDFAIQREQESYEFYMDLASRVKKSGISELFKQFAQEENGHKKKLLDIKAGKQLLLKQEQIKDLKIGDFLLDTRPSTDLDYQQALVLAMKKEKAAFKMYTDLATLINNPDLKQTFLVLAQEEAKHKLRFEVEYDDEILVEN